MERREFGIKVVSPAVFTLALFLVWEVMCRALEVPLTILPAPSDVFGALWQYRAPIADNSFVTLWTTLAGFLIATVFGLVLGIAVGWHRALYAGIYPVLIGFNSIPKVAVVPVEAKVAAILRPIWPDLPSPLTISLPVDSSDG